MSDWHVLVRLLIAVAPLIVLAVVWYVFIRRADRYMTRMFGTIIPPEKPRNTVRPRLPR